MIKRRNKAIEEERLREKKEPRRAQLLNLEICKRSKE